MSRKSTLIPGKWHAARARTTTELEDQLCAMRPDGYAGAGSPDRLDALVWAVTELSGPPSVGYMIGSGRPVPTF